MAQHILLCGDSTGSGIKAGDMSCRDAWQRRGNMPDTFRPFRHRLEYVLFHALRSIAVRVSEPASCRLGRCLGDLIYLLSLGRRRVAKENVSRVMRLSFANPEVKRIARASFRNLVQVAIEFARMPRDLHQQTGSRFFDRIEGLEKVQETLAAGRGLVFITGHTGNWELMGAYVSSCVVPMTCVASAFRNPLLEQYVRGRREQYRQTIVYKRGAIMKTARTLKKGGVVAFLVDQHAGHLEPKIDFMGIPAYTFSTPGALAVRFQAPVMAGFCYRVDSRCRYSGYFEDPLYPDPNGDPEDEIMRVTRYANESLGRFIHAHPEQWLWMHRRWR